MITTDLQTNDVFVLNNKPYKVVSINKTNNSLRVAELNYVTENQPALTSCFDLPLVMKEADLLIRIGSSVKVNRPHSDIILGSDTGVVTGYSKYNTTYGKDYKVKFPKVKEIIIKPTEII